MDEVFPVLAGIGLGLATSAVRANWLKSLLLAVLGLAIGATASWVSGELAISWVYVLIDTAQVVGASMLSLDGAEHKRHRDPFARPFRLDAVRARFTEAVAAETDRLIDAKAHNHIEMIGHKPLDHARHAGRVVGRVTID